MSTVIEGTRMPASPAVREHERKRGMWGMWLFIGTEAALFVLLFFAYFYLASSNTRWPLHELPEYTKALIMVGVLIASSISAEWGSKGMLHGHSGRLKIGLVVTLLLACIFLWLSWLDYNARLEKVVPTDNAYGSITYTIISLHLAHLLLGMMMLGFVLARAFAGHFSRERHVAVKNATLYWHFVDLVWIFVVAIVYLSPHVTGATP